MLRIMITTMAFALLFLGARAQAQENASTCTAQDQACLFNLLEQTANTVEEASWQDTTWREMAKLLTHEGQAERAIALIARIKNPDTQAMTIRGIGMAAADSKLDKENYDKIFTALRAEAEKISHPPSYAIALTYISMAQAFAGDNEGAMKTASEMKNDALRHKAYGEAAEIQAERGDLSAASISLAAIDDPAYFDKQGRIVAKIFSDRGHYDAALATALKISNPYQKSQALLYLLTRQIKPEEVSIE